MLTGLSKEFLPASVHCSLVDMRVIGEEVSSSVFAKGGAQGNGLRASTTRPSSRA
jgi:hypothetical protein